MSGQQSAIRRKISARSPKASQGTAESTGFGSIASSWGWLLGGILLWAVPILGPVLGSLCLLHFLSLCVTDRRIFKWTAIVIGGPIILLLALGVYSAITATPEEKAKWAAEQALREQERARERAVKAKREAEKEAAHQQAKAEKAAKEAQFKCLNAWNGEMFTFVRAIKDGLRDPDSFELVNSYASPVKSNGLQIIRMEFRARNGFGGMNVESASGLVKNSDCELISWSMDR